jgi:hypothetical protein
MDKARIPSILIKTAKKKLVKADINHHFPTLLPIS